jgi:DNA ligase D-like protein (predicted ligase)
MNELLEKLPKELQEKLNKRKMPSFEIPMLCTLTNNYFSDKDWIYERKLDGVRCLIFKDKDKVILKSRNNKDVTDTFPEIAEAARKFDVNQVILDGEIITFKNEVSSFEKLQPRIGVKNPSKELIKKVKIYIYVFDMLYLDGYEILKLPLIKRKSLLKKAIKFRGPIRYEVHRNKEGLSLFKAACKKNWEGLIAKKRNSIYVHFRSKNWLKFKCIEEQEFVVGGYTDPQGSRVGFGALLLGYFKDDKFMYCGKLGTGFNDAFLESFSKKMQKIEIKKNPFANKKLLDVTKHVHFVEPQLVVEVGFEEWTKDNKLRQPRLLGIRLDKDAKDVVKETPKSIVPKDVKMGD